jgi:glycosyltransferase involved in cell wall biosynthesis
MPKVSVIVPVYNVEEYIEECLDSLVNQTMEDIEIIVVNDGSPDNSANIVVRYCKKYSNMTLINQENGGLSKARNTGLKAASGEYIFFLDSDDYLPLDSLEKMYTRAINDCSDLVIGAINNVTSTGISKNTHQMFAVDRTTTYENFPVISENLGVTNKLYKRELIFENNLYFIEERKNCEDIPFSFTAYSLANKISIVKDCIYYYRRRDGSITSSVSLDFLHNFCLSMIDAKEIIKRHKTNYANKIIEYIERKEIVDILWFALLSLARIETEDGFKIFNETINKWLSNCSEREILSNIGRSVVRIIENRVIDHSKKVDILKTIINTRRITRRDLVQVHLQKNITYKDVFNKIVEFEVSRNIFNEKINNIYFWRLIRYELVEELQQKLLGHQPPNSKKIVLDEHLRKIRRKDLSSYGSYSKDIILIDHLRKELIDGKYVDFRTVEIIKKLKEKNASFEVIELPFDGRHYIVGGENRKYMDDYISFIDNVGDNIDIKFTIRDKRIINDIHDFIWKEFNCSLDLEKLIRKRMQKFIAEFLFFMKLLKNRKTKQLFIVGEAWFPGAIHAAETLGIQTCGIQYALTGKYHPAFDYPKGVRVPYYPQKMILWGEYWHQICNLPVPKENIYYLTHSVLRNRLLQIRNYEKNNKSVLFMSQGAVRDKLFGIALEFAKNNRDYEIRYKLHPKESLTAQQMAQASELDNLEVIEKADNFLLYGESEYLVSVYSTCIYEGSAAGCKIILVNLPGVELFHDLLEENHAVLVNDAYELERVVRNEWTKDSLDLEALYPDINNYDEVII